MKGKYRIRFYKDVSGEWRWHMSASNGKFIAESGEGYKRRADARKMAKKIVECTRQDVLFDDEVVEDLPVV